MAQAERKVVAYVDFEAVRPALEAARSASGLFGQRLVSLARAHGRLLSANVYGDLDNDDAKELKRAGCDVRLTSEDGDGSAPESIAIVLDAAEALAAGPSVDVVVLVTDDAQLSELVRRLRKGARYVVLVSPAQYAEGEPGRSADRTITIEALLEGSVAAALPVAAEPRQERPARVRPPSGQTIDFDSYDWAKLVVLMRDLEAKMPFVGMRWLKNKVIGPHNVGAVTIADKQLLLNRAVDAGLIETYRVGNRDEQGDPVTACRLLRENERVKSILDLHPAPPPATDPSTTTAE